MNKVILIGNLTKDLELSTSASGIAFCRFSLAVSRRFTNSEGERETDFINIVVWRDIAVNCHKFLKKGSKIGVVGSLQTRTYDAQDGTKRYVTEVLADEVDFISTKKPEDNGAVPEEKKEEDITQTSQELQPVPVDEDQLPF